MLQRAAAASTKVLADWFGTLVAAFVNMEHMPPIRVTGDAFHRDGFAGERVRHINCAVGGIGDTVTAMAQPRNIELFSHAQLQAGIRRFHRRP